MDRELVEQFIKGFEQHDGRYLGGQHIKKVRWNEVAHVVRKLVDGTTINTKDLVAMGRQANIEDLNLSAVGIIVSDKGAKARSR